MDWEPDGRQTAEPEDEETDKVFGGGAGAGDMVGDIGVAGPNGSDHDSDTFTSNPSLNTIPNTLPCISQRLDIKMFKGNNIQPLQHD